MDDDLRTWFNRERRAMINAFAEVNALAVRAGADHDAVTEAQGRFFDANVEIKHAFGCAMFIADIGAEAYATPGAIMTGGESDIAGYDPAADHVHGSGWNSAARWGGWSWRAPRDGEWFRTCSFCGCTHPEDLAPELVTQGPCLECGNTGWSACFDGQQPGWYPRARANGDFDHLPAEEIARFDAKHAPHRYNPGGAYLSWADRKYGWPHKTYVENLASREPERLHVISTHRGATEGPYAPGGEKYQPLGGQWIRPSEIPPGTVTDGRGDLDEDRDRVQLGTRPTLFAKFYTKHLADPAISQDAKDAIGRASGLRITFTDDGHVSWGPWVTPDQMET